MSAVRGGKIRSPGRSWLALAALLLAVALAPAAAQEATPESEAELDWYRVEVIVFRQPPLPDEAPEAPPLATTPPDGRPLQPLRGGADGETPFARLPPAALELGGVAQRLERQPGFGVLVHAAWEQPGLGRGDAPYVPVPFGLRPPPDTAEDAAAVDAAGDGGARPGPFAMLPPDVRLYGTLRLYRERYLHFETDLRYRQAGEPPAAIRLDEALAPDPAYDPGLQVMTVNRRMRSDELHYLDHPVLGVIVRAVPLEDD